MNITVIDKRLANEVVNFGPSYSKNIEVDENTAMTSMLQEIKDSVSRSVSGKIDFLIIAAHGYAVKGRDGNMHLGFGMQFCKEDLTIDTAHYFKMLNGLFNSKDSGIVLLGCGVASKSEVETSAGTEKGFGSDLCKALVRYTSTEVIASPNVQDITIGKINRRSKVGTTIESVNALDPGPWEGELRKFSPGGKSNIIPNDFMARKRE